MKHTLKDLEAVEEALDQGDFKKAVQLSLEYLDSKSVPVRQHANRLAGLSYFQLKKYKKALSHFQEVLKGTKLSLDDYFNTVTSASMSGDEKTAKKAFQEFIEVAQKKRIHPEDTLTIPRAHYYYGLALLEGKLYKESFKQLETLRGWHEDIGITDDHFLIVRGMTYLGQTLELAKELKKAMESYDWDKWANRFAKKLDDDGKQRLSKF